DLHEAGEVFFAEPFRDLRDTSSFVAGNLQQGRIFAGDLRHRGVTNKTNQLTGEVSGTMPLHDQLVDDSQSFFTRVLLNGLHDAFEHFRVDGSDQPANHFSAQGIPDASDRLVHDAERVAHRTVTGFGEHGESIIVDLNAFLLRDRTQLSDDVVEFHRM